LKGVESRVMDSETIGGPVIEKPRDRVGDDLSRGRPAPQLIALVERAKSQLAGVTGLKAQAVSSVVRDGVRWRLRIDMLEMARIPPATDVIGEYEVSLDEDGTMAGFERRRSRLRGDVSEEGEG
jgi:hypothetical protein